MAIIAMEQARPSIVHISNMIIYSFERRWRKKMVHARLNGFINHHYDKEAVASGKFGKGGFTLRDDLYAIAKKQRKN